MIDIKSLGLDGVMEISIAKHGDERGFFSETYNLEQWSKAGIDTVFVQDNHSFSAAKGVLRGMHYQKPPFAQAKLVRVIKGAIFDVAVDIREGAPTFGKWVGLEISAPKWNQILVPSGFAHGFVTLTPNTEVLYKVSRTWSREHEVCIRFDDPDIAIDWPFASGELTLSAKDQQGGLLKDTETGFSWP